MCVLIARANIIPVPSLKTSKGLQGGHVSGPELRCLQRQTLNMYMVMRAAKINLPT